jgi:hypothetical protein
MWRQTVRIRSLNRTVAASINGGYRIIEILKEVIDNYPLMNLFNMMDTGASYDGTSYGYASVRTAKTIHCNRIKAPVSNNDPGLAEYRRFQQETSNELYMKKTGFIKQQNPILYL